MKMRTTRKPSILYPSSSQALQEKQFLLQALGAPAEQPRKEEALLSCCLLLLLVQFEASLRGVRQQGKLRLNFPETVWPLQQRERALCMNMQQLFLSLLLLPLYFGNKGRVRRYLERRNPIDRCALVSKEWRKKEKRKERGLFGVSFCPTVQKRSMCKALIAFPGRKCAIMYFLSIISA